jgi:hypothetical protein
MESIESVDIEENSTTLYRINTAATFAKLISSLSFFGQRVRVVNADDWALGRAPVANRGTVRWENIDTLLPVDSKSNHIGE